ncbi:hypothetical protein PVAP13_5KG148214 [Panicum virgatum]|uniref:Uncharacterized protein n=1 Tax=Panicum virgatum TaxID=38727 RepID=A0A8T0SI41_PANVG|nr:hypothetical protein PVAP13_5KG148214 [Panicum virgatum]
MKTQHAFVDKKGLYSYMHTLFMATCWTQCWSILPKERDKQRMKWACHVLDTAAMEIFAKHGWLSSNILRI